ncbi:MAG: excinuclease ABC subunit A, partial [Proteobacteria bacterium]|nr:excinuclease ABC subunit A [Pseudomonadota bacterium]
LLAPKVLARKGEYAKLFDELQAKGFMRARVDGKIIELEDAPTLKLRKKHTIEVVVDRLKVSAKMRQRLAESFETALGLANGIARILINDKEEKVFSAKFACPICDYSLTELEPRIFSFNSPMGACPECEGFGNVIDIDMELVVRDPNQSIREGAIAPWNTPAYAHELEELLALAPDYKLRTDVPYRELSEDERRLIVEGVRERNFGGLAGFFAWLERRKYKMHVRVFLSRWRSYRPCPECCGARLRPEALATRVGAS